MEMQMEQGLAALSPWLRDGTSLWTGFGMEQVLGSLGMGFADLTRGEFCCSKSPWWPTSPVRAHKMFTHWSGSQSLGAGMEGASGWEWRQNLPKNRQQRGEPQTTLQPRCLGKLWQT